MSLNEFVLGFVGVLIGLGVADLLTSFHKLLRAGRRVKWDWLTLLYAAYMLFSLIVFWWWQFEFPPPGTSLTIAQFLGNFLFLALSFLMVASALPDDVPAEGLDLRDYYMSSLRHRWGLLTIGLAYNWAGGTLAALAGGVGALTRADALGAIGLVFLCVVLAACAMRIRAVWYQALALAILFATTSYFNLFRPIGP